MDNKNPEYKHGFLELSKAPDRQTLATIEEMTEIIRSTGCSLHLYTDKSDRQYLMLTINCETAKNSRGAGRRKKLVSKEHWRITCGEVRKMLETKTAEEVAAELEISRATLFRRLKDRQDNQRF